MRESGAPMMERWRQGNVRKNCLFTVEGDLLVATFERNEDAARACAAVLEQAERYEADLEKKSDG
jgi:hypothetical protein